MVGVDGRMDAVAAVLVDTKNRRCQRASVFLGLLIPYVHVVYCVAYEEANAKINVIE